ncbi:MAG TPA: hypothetical protein DD456_13560 [Stenotrophomonas sp.]|nr:hypothetical protein [Stenotrophomonas sp.]
MRDLSAHTFEALARAVGFKHVPEGREFVSLDGRVRISAVYRGKAYNYTETIDRRQTLAAMKRASQAHRAAQAANSEATGAATPMASSDQSQEKDRA